MALVGLAALWKSERLRPYALWMTLIAAGILLSIPFAPPWDAAERPFAATVPFQGLLAGIGFFALCQKFFSKKSEAPCNLPTPKSCDLFFLSLMALLVFFLTVPFPLLHQKTALLSTKNNSAASVAFRTGSFVIVTPENSVELSHRMIPFLAHYPSEADFFAHLPRHFILGIDWDNKNFDRSVLLDAVGETVPFRGWQVDKRLLLQN